ncbi:MAG: DUF3413 domain-containing protein [SAR324 cluster bacterium]
MAESRWRRYSKGRGQTLRWVGWMILANVAVLLVMGTTYMTYAADALTWAGAVFLGLSLLSQFLLLAFLTSLPLLLLALVLPRRAALAAGIVGYTALTLLVLVDTRVFSIYRFHLNGMVWQLLTSGVASEILPLTVGFWLLLAGYVAGLALVQCVLGYLVWKWLSRRPSRLGGWVTVAAVVLTLAPHVLHAWADANEVTAITRQTRYIPWEVMSRAGDFFEKHGWAAPENAALARPAGGLLHYPLEPLTCVRPAKPLNILVMIADGWRFDFLTPEITPNAMAVAQQGWRFTDHFSTANETRDGIFGVMYGLWATYYDDFLRERRGPVLIDQLLAEGYKLGVWGSAPMNHPELDLTSFAAIRQQLTIQLPGSTAWERDAEMTRRFEEFLDANRSGPFFGFLFYDSTHEYSYDPAIAPFQPVARGSWSTSPPGSRDLLRIRNRYMDATHYADLLMGKAIAKLKAVGRYDDTVIVLTGDHGEEFNDAKHDFWGHEGAGLDRWQMKTTFVVRWPGRKPQVFTHRTGHVDLVPTLMHDVLGCSNPPQDYSNGRNLLDTSPRPFLVAFNGIRLAVIEPDRTDVLYDFGGTDFVDLDYNAIPGSVPRPAVMDGVVRDTSRFYRH